MEIEHKKDTFTITGVFATREDAENAYHLLIMMGYTPEEITLIMSDKTKEKLYHKNVRTPFDSAINAYKENSSLTIADVVASLGRYVSLPGVALVVAGDFNDAGVSAVSGLVMSDKYAQYYRTRINDGEIVIDFQPHTVKEINMITGHWENYGGDPMIRRNSNAA